MGMPITVDIPECMDESVFEEVYARLHEIDRRFSPYKISSEVRKFQRGKLDEAELSAEFKKIMAMCHEAEVETNGYFTPYFSGKYDPTGLVKGWAIAEAGTIIEKAGFKTYCIGAGGDILARSTSDKIWNIGIINPKDKHALIGKISAKNFAVATSGNYERGKHIINPKTGKRAIGLLSVSVTGPDIVKADILATAIFAAGQRGLDMAEELNGYEALAVDKNNKLTSTSGMPAILV
jgi:thiamine biosynthesis lipoprotein